MKTDGNNSFWGTSFDEDEREDIKKLLGHDLSLQTSGDNADKTEAKETATEILESDFARGKTPGSSC